MWNKRLRLLVGEQKLEKLANSVVTVVGVGGVGSFVAESLARSNIGKLILIDYDDIDITNLNRQVHATIDTVGKKKVYVMQDRIKSINKKCEVIAHDEFISEENIAKLIPENVDYIVDAIDVVASKLALIEYAQKKNIKIISSLGMGNRLDPTMIKLVTLDKTSNDPLARVIRQQARKRGLNLKLPVVYSCETPNVEIVEINEDGETMKQKHTIASAIFVPASAGLIIGSKVLKDIMEE